MNSTAADVILTTVARDEASILANLFELYAHDFSEHVPLPIQASGRFEVALGDAWWTRDDHFAYFIKVGGELTGFALLRVGSRVTQAPDVMDMAEFFVLRGWRRRGVGRGAAHALFKAFPRAWEVRVRETNVAALGFWCEVVQSWVGHSITKRSFSVEGVAWDRLCFVTAGR